MVRFSEAQKQDRRQVILEAALRRFSRTGFHNTTTADIVREAGVAQGTFYLYFSTKDDVIAALADDRRHSEALINAIADAESDPLAALALLLELHGESLADEQSNDVRRVAVQGWAEAMRSDLIRQRLLENSARVRDEIARIVERGQRTGQFRASADPQAFARALIALFRGLTLQAAWDESYDPNLIGETVGDMIRGALSPYDPGAAFPERQREAKP